MSEQYAWRVASDWAPLTVQLWRLHRAGREPLVGIRIEGKGNPPLMIGLEEAAGLRDVLDDMLAVAGEHRTIEREHPEGDAT